MPPKSQKASSSKGRSSEEEKEQVLQAVILADTFETKFTPFTLERPRCLLPLLSTPLIEYTLEYLASAGVHEVYLYAGAHVDQVEAYITASKWKVATSPFRKFVFLRTMAASVGDVLRDLDQKDLMAGDFLCVSGDIVSNFPIDEALRRHKARRAKDKNAIMTMLLHEAQSGVLPGQGSVVPTFVLDPSKDRCLHYEEAIAGRGSHSSIDPDMLQNPEVDIRQDLIDCRIDICTPDVLSLWSDNFDNQAPRKDFLHGVLKDYELNGKTIHTHIITDYYASRVCDLLSYDRTSTDILKRWASPICVDNNIFADMAYKLQSKGIYRESDVVLARSSGVESRTMLGRGTTVGAGSIIRNSIIGRRCHIGKNVNIEGCYVWDDATIGNNATITKAIVANEASIGDRSTISEGALISYGVRVDSGASVPVGAKLTKIKQNGYDENSEEEPFDVSGLIYKQPGLAVSSDTIGSDESEEDEPSEVASGPSSRAPSMSEGAPDGDTFHREVVNSIFGRMQENASPDDVKVELISSRLAHNATPHQVRRAVAVALMKHIQTVVEKGNGSPAEVSAAALDRYKSLVGGAQDTVDDQVDFLLEAQKDLTHRSEGGKILLFFTKELYDQEVLGEDVFMQWWDDAKSSADAEMKRVREPSQQFIEWLRNAESESEGESEDEEEEE
jgi:translation initiation factor eIF-2B subunit epsilon